MASAEALGRDLKGIVADRVEKIQRSSSSSGGEEEQKNGTDGTTSRDQRAEGGPGDDTNDEGGQKQGGGEKSGKTVGADPRSVGKGEKRENCISKGGPDGGEKCHLRHFVASAEANAHHPGSRRGQQEGRGEEKEGIRGSQESKRCGEGKCQSGVDDGEKGGDKKGQQQHGQQQQHGRATNGLAGGETTDGRLGKPEGRGVFADRVRNETKRELFEGKGATARKHGNESDRGMDKSCLKNGARRRLSR